MYGAIYIHNYKKLCIYLENMCLAVHQYLLIGAIKI